MKRLILPLFIFHFCSTYGQHWLEPTARWNYSVYWFTPSGSVTVQIDKDTIIEQHHCQVLRLKNHSIVLSKTYPDVLYTYVENDTINYYVDYKFRPTIDLNAKLGDTLKLFTKDLIPSDTCYTSDSLQIYLVDSIFQTAVDTFNLKTFRCRKVDIVLGMSEPNQFIFSEKIGFWNYPYPIIGCNTDPVFPALCNYGDSTISGFWMFPNIKTCEAVGIEELSSKQVVFSISPNPSSSTFTLEIDKFSGNPFEVLLVNMQGQKVKTIHIDKPKTDISCVDLPEGIYFLKSENSTPSKVMVLH